MWTSIAIAAGASAALQVLCVIVFAAIRRGTNIYAAVIAFSFLTAPAAWLADGWLFDGALGVDGRVFLVVMHLAIGGLFFHFMTLPDRSVTLRILVELLLAPGQQLSIAQLNDRYSLRAMIESRVRQMQDGGFLEIRPDRTIVLTKRGESFGRFVTAGRRLFGIESAN